MENEKYYQAFRDLGIKVEPLPSNYNPEEYGLGCYQCHSLKMAFLMLLPLPRTTW